MTTIKIDKEEYDLLKNTLNHYKELIDHYEAIEIAEREKKENKIEKLNSLEELKENE